MITFLKPTLNGRMVTAPMPTRRRDQFDELLVCRFGHKHIILQRLSRLVRTCRSTQVNSYLSEAFRLE